MTELERSVFMSKVVFRKRTVFRLNELFFSDPDEFACQSRSISIAGKRDCYISLQGGIRDRVDFNRLEND